MMDLYNHMFFREVTGEPSLSLYEFENYCDLQSADIWFCKPQLCNVIL